MLAILSNLISADIYPLLNRAVVDVMQKNKLDYKTQMLASACDIDMKCVQMGYIQLSLLGIPATVIHGDSLLMEEWSRWYTPAYVLGKWPLKEHLASLKDPSKTA